MTAEVALLNKNAVALAADSAVTVSGARGNKIYNAANKLFALSNHEPIGVMVYGNAEFMGVPWETIIKIYRRQLGENSFPAVKDYFDDFKRFLGSNDQLFGEETQKNHVLEIANGAFKQIRELLRARVDALTKDGAEVDESLIQKLQSGLINSERDRLAMIDFSLTMDAAYEASVRALYADVIGSAIASTFEKLPLSTEDSSALSDIVIFILTRKDFPAGTSGVVIAGFGTAEHFPALSSATVQARVAGRLKYGDVDETTITDRSGAAVAPFAQTDAVQLFIEGIDPTHAIHAVRMVKETLEGFKQDILNSLEMSDEDKKTASEEWGKLADIHWRTFNERAKQRRQRDYISPLVDVIEILPKDELAAVAEALVNITSLRRKISMDAETVGGPIDVAVISKGDGLVWIRRKHYFRPELNPRYFGRIDGTTPTYERDER